MTASTRVFQASDLNQNGRTLLETARTGEARLRDKDGLSLLILPEARVQTLRAIARAAANLATVEHALTLCQPPLTLGGYGEWTWLRHLPYSDLALFLDDVRQAIVVAAHEDTPTSLEETLGDWRVTADQLAAPQRRAVLLGDRAIEDFSEVARPGTPTA